MNGTICKPCVNRVIRAKRYGKTAVLGMESKIRELIERYVCKEANRETLQGIADKVVAKYRGSPESKVLGIVEIELGRYIDSITKHGLPDLDSIADPRSLPTTDVGFSLSDVLEKLTPYEQSLTTEVLVPGGSCSDFALLHDISERTVREQVERLKGKVAKIIIGL